MTTDRVRVLRLVEYEGPREWVERTVEKSIHGTKDVFNGTGAGGPYYIRAVTLGSFPEILKAAEGKSE